MGKYRISESEIRKEWAQFRKKMPPFVPFNMDNTEKLKIGEKFLNLIATQNGRDLDDYVIRDDNKVEKYLSDVTVGSKVLFLGAGTGREIKVALEMGLDAYGTTLGSRNIAFSKGYVGLPDDRLVEVINESLPWASETFDYVVGFQVFEHVIAPLMFLLEQGRVLKTNGKLLLELRDASYSSGADPHVQVCYTPGQAQLLFLKAGFEDIKVFYGDHIPIPEKKLWDAKHGLTACIIGTKKAKLHEFL
jgi:SAM-dependent methyltransferase